MYKKEYLVKVRGWDTSAADDYIRNNPNAVQVCYYSLYFLSPVYVCSGSGSSSSSHGSSSGSSSGR